MSTTKLVQDYFPGLNLLRKCKKLGARKVVSLCEVKGLLVRFDLSEVKSYWESIFRQHGRNLLKSNWFHLQAVRHAHTSVTARLANQIEKLKKLKKKYENPPKNKKKKQRLAPPPPPPPPPKKKKKHNFQKKKVAIRTQR